VKHNHFSNGLGARGDFPKDVKGRPGRLWCADRESFAKDHKSHKYTIRNEVTDRSKNVVTKSSLESGEKYEHIGTLFFKEGQRKMLGRRRGDLDGHRSF